MSSIDNSPKDIIRFLDEQGLSLKKRWGQNFMIDPGTRRRIVDLLDVRDGDRVWEVGPGLGAMTQELLGRGARVCSFEIDHGLIRTLKHRFADAPWVVIQGDAAETWKSAVDEGPRFLLGNLPYSTASRILGSFLEGGLDVERMVVTVQREAAERIAAPQTHKAYGGFSVLCQSVYETEIAFQVPGNSFFPKPRVTSSTVLMNRRENPLIHRSERAKFAAFIRTAFGQPRKTLMNNLGSAYDGDALKQSLAKLHDEKVRPGAVTVAQFVELFGFLKDRKKEKKAL